MTSSNGIYSSKILKEEIKYRIKLYYGSQEKFAKEFGSSRKTLNHLVNHLHDYEAIERICKMLRIKGITF